MWRERLFRGEAESESEKIGSKMGPESEILWNSAEFHPESTTKVADPKMNE